MIFVISIFGNVQVILLQLESRSRSRTSRSQSRLLWQSLGLASKFDQGLGFGLGGYGLDYITVVYLPPMGWCLA